MSWSRTINRSRKLRAQNTADRWHAHAVRAARKAAKNQPEESHRPAFAGQLHKTPAPVAALLLLIGAVSLNANPESSIQNPVSSVRLQALALVESGNNPAAVGKAGETTRYQMIPAVRREYGSAERVLQARCTAFTARFQRPCNDVEFYLLWHRPARVTNPKRVELERAQRYANTVQKLKGK